MPGDGIHILKVGVLMIKIEKTDVYGFDAAIRGMRNPLNSWEKSDSWYGCKTGRYGHKEADTCGDACRFDCEFCVGENDMKLMKQLVKAGSDHSKFMRMINVTCDITAPLYWWKEFDTYKVGTVRLSCSTMHTIHKRKFTIDDFSHEWLEDMGSIDNPVPYSEKIKYLVNADYLFQRTIDAINCLRENYINTKDKKYWYQMIQLLPSSYNQRATVQMNYAVLRNMYHARKNHKLDEWHRFCEWVESLPESELITEGA